MAPVLETARLRLRNIAEDDLDSWADVMAREEVVRHLGGSPQSREESWRRLLGCAGSWSVLGFGYWAVELRDRPGIIGLVGFADFKRDMTPCIEGLPEMGWIFAPEAQGKGLAAEAVAAGLAWADERLAGREIVAIIAPDNAPSIRLAEKSGFGLPGQATFKGEPALLFHRPPKLT